MYPNVQEKEVIVGFISDECLTPLDFLMILANDFGHKVAIIDLYCCVVTRSQTRTVIETIISVCECSRTFDQTT